MLDHLHTHDSKLGVRELPYAKRHTQLVVGFMKGSGFADAANQSKGKGPATRS